MELCTVGGFVTLVGLAFIAWMTTRASPSSLLGGAK
jgi:hypothetical protein